VRNLDNQSPLLKIQASNTGPKTPKLEHLRMKIVPIYDAQRRQLGMDTLRFPGFTSFLLYML
jgi:hypothetical protein